MFLRENDVIYYNVVDNV